MNRDEFIAWVQAILTFVLVAAFIVLLWRGESAAAAVDKLKDYVGMAVMFWLMRHRQSGSADGEVDPNTTLTTTTTASSKTTAPASPDAQPAERAG